MFDTSVYVEAFRRGLASAAPFAARGRVLTPRREDWVRAGQGLADLARANPGLRDKTRLLWNDALILLSAQQIGAPVITVNVEDFRLLQLFLGGTVAALGL